MVYEVKQLILKKIPGYEDITLDRFKVRFWINNTMPWQWYPSITEEEPPDPWIYTSMEGEVDATVDTIIGFNSFDARKIEIYYELTP